MLQLPPDQFLSQLPAILIVSCATVVDRCLRADLLEERFRTQVWLWLCALMSLHAHPKNEDEENSELVFETWVHLIIVSNFVAIGWFAALGPIHQIQKKNKITLWLPFSAWNAMMSASCLFSDFYNTKQAEASFSVQVYFLSLAGSWIFQWHRKRKENLDKELRRITNSSVMNPVVSASTRNGINLIGGIDESEWYNWSVSTTLRWISHVFTSQEDDDTTIIQQLAPHRIHGALLDTLTVTQLLALQAPYGNACRLTNAIQTQLTRRHPKPREAETTINLGAFVTNGQESQSDWLSNFDQEYNRNRGNTYSSQQYVDPLRSTEDSLSVDAQANIHPEQEQRMETIMKERFGLELPKLKMNNPESEMQENTLAHPLMDHKKASSSISNTRNPLPKPVAVSKSPAKVPTALRSLQSTINGPSMGGVQPSILEQMPANIQEIAKRRPDLVRQLLQSHQSQVQNHKQQQSSALHPLQEEESQDDDDERTSLIRRKPQQPKYESTDSVVN